jgi:hypothetical protein
MEWINLAIGILGLVLACVALYFSDFINPWNRFRKYLRKSEDWEPFYGTEGHVSRWRHIKYPYFQIVIDWEKEVGGTSGEEWIKNIFLRNPGNNISYLVRLEVNGMLLNTESFLSVDGHSYFIPWPRMLFIEDEASWRYFYDGLQIDLVNIIGRFRGVDDIKNIYNFVERQDNLTINECL